MEGNHVTSTRAPKALQAEQTLSIGVFLKLICPYYTADARFCLNHAGVTTQHPFFLLLTHLAVLSLGFFNDSSGQQPNQPPLCSAGSEVPSAVLPLGTEAVMRQVLTSFSTASLVRENHCLARSAIAEGAGPVQGHHSIC